LPVEVWSRFMKAAHQGTPATDLPVTSAGLASPGAVASGGPAPLPMAPAPIAAPMPAAAIPGRGREPIRPAEGTIDGWLMERLFPGR